ncbi:MAG TPA: HipA domain-containing protein [Steroidobacter sp.]|nr:HipA domain-containing protein [Steroidobacter sp.]
MWLEIYLEGSWVRCAELIGTEGDRQQPIQLTYSIDYAVDRLFARDLRAVSIRVPVDLGTRQYSTWPAFLIDLLPQGAARRRLERAARIQLSDWAVLQRGAINPVGNLRIVGNTPAVTSSHRSFSLREITQRGDEFLEYAAGAGAAVTGATDTQGEAPKFWVVQDASGHWYPDDGNCDAFASKFALLKFPVPEAGSNAERILRHEALFQRVARRIGLRTTEELPEFVDGALLVPRFDRRRKRLVERLGVESLYSVTGIVDSARQPLRHDQVLFELAEILTNFDEELCEYVRRDLFNLAVGNRDNHGRNTAILKDVDGTMRLAPIFDVGPSFLDGRAIARVIRWDGERASEHDWHTVLERLNDRNADHRARGGRAQIDATRVARCMYEFADRIAQLPTIMRECEVDATIIEQRQPEIARLASSLAKLRGAQ